MAGNVVYQDRVVWKQNYGLKDKKHQGDAPDQDTVFRVASISKIFTVSLIPSLHFQLASITTFLISKLVVWISCKVGVTLCSSSSFSSSKNLHKIVPLSSLINLMLFQPIKKYSRAVRVTFDHSFPAEHADRTLSGTK